MNLTVKLTPDVTSPGPYSIYYNNLSNLVVTSISQATLSEGLNITIPDTATSLIILNTRSVCSNTITVNLATPPTIPGCSLVASAVEGSLGGVVITLTVAGSDTGPFDLYSDYDSYTTPFDTSVPKSSLIAGYTVAVPVGTTSIKVKNVSPSTCINETITTVLPYPGEKFLGFVLAHPVDPDVYPPVATVCGGVGNRIQVQGNDLNFISSTNFTSSYFSGYADGTIEYLGSGSIGSMFYVQVSTVGGTETAVVTRPASFCI